MQKYKEFSESNNFGVINGYMLLKLNVCQLKLMSEIDLNLSDWMYVPLYEEYMEMRSNGEKSTYIISKLSTDYHISESSVKRLIRRFSRRVTV